MFSCGGLIAHQTAKGESVTVITICAGDPSPGELSTFAQQLHARWNVDRASIEVRRSEDLAACEHLCAGVIHFEIPDAIYRKSPDGETLYPDERAIFGTLHENDTDLVVRLSRKLANIVSDESVLYCPLGFGGHVDHSLVRHAAERLNRALRFYADLPYAARGEPLGDGLSLPRGERRVFKLEAEDIEAWVAASALYRTQLSTFWTDESTLRAELCGFLVRDDQLPIIVQVG